MTDVETREAVSPSPARRPSLARNWRYALRTGNPPHGRVDLVSRWLVLTRASVLPMTITSAAIAGLLAAYRDESVTWWLFTLAAVGLVLAHCANNLMNDLFDLEVGADTESYPRALYAPHPVLSGMTTRRGLLASALAVNALDLVILAVLFVARGWPVVAFALGGFLLSIAYTAPPLRLKKHGLGEPTVLVVWGPLMVGGTYYAATGHLPGAVLGASLPYALLCTAVLMGKHLDKAAWDAPAGTRTLPVILGDEIGRAVTRGIIVAFFALVALLVAVTVLPLATLLVVASAPLLKRVWRAFGRPKPESPPADYPIWPLWFAAHAFVLTRRAGALFLLGLVVGVFTGW
jgi:1,4-dihydroxy-2-naphthoate polyprenyltransferase